VAAGAALSLSIGYRGEALGLSNGGGNRDMGRVIAEISKLSRGLAGPSFWTPS
jgi:hypothetical protein